MMAKVLRDLLQERKSDSVEVLPFFDELLRSLSQVSEEFRREMASILEQYGCDTDKLSI